MKVNTDKISKTKNLIFVYEKPTDLVKTDSSLKGFKVELQQFNVPAKIYDLVDLVSKELFKKTKKKKSTSEIDVGKIVLGHPTLNSIVNTRVQKNLLKKDEVKHLLSSRLRPKPALFPRWHCERLYKPSELNDGRKYRMAYSGSDSVNFKIVSLVSIVVMDYIKEEFNIKPDDIIKVGFEVHTTAGEFEYATANMKFKDAVKVAGQSWKHYNGKTSGNFIENRIRTSEGAITYGEFVDMSFIDLGQKFNKYNQPTSELLELSLGEIPIELYG